MRDVIVVGAGPAGSAVACHLARSGLDVLVLEKASAAPAPSTTRASCAWPPGTGCRTRPSCGSPSRSSAPCPHRPPRPPPTGSRPR
ncbi:FAD-dependent oxidoreductase [Actinomadura meridiana]|uniref:FAD-dependent oxidoreductase n=1 Tax=Actinomadura meridiana TaxID=559626 RepID=UPI003CD0655C